MGFYNELSDQELAVFLKKGDHVAFKELYNRYWAIMLNTAYKRLDSRDAAEEVVQELFVTLYTKRENIRENENLEGYMRTALKRKVLNTFRSQQVHNKYLDSVIAENRIETRSADHELQVKELSRKLEIAASKMPEKCRQVFILSRIEQLSNRSIAEKLGISVSTVEKHISKAMKIMASDFSDYNLGLIAFILFLNAV